MGKVIGNVQVQKRGVISLGLVKDHLRIAEGDILRVEIEDGRIILSPMVLVPAEQAYFWSEEWQAAEKEAEYDIRNGRTRSFENVDDLLEDLDG
ncbi:MAG: AbrB/MazE/SpoVT family DNA-binding domain-containing protein [Bacillota bacterium]|nr:AbrB/MazE/SpoVT family DNA-binding domain-containing protein [Bacillota bacterium]